MRLSPPIALSAALACLSCLSGCDKAGAGSREPVVTDPKVIPGMEPKKVAPGDPPVFAGETQPGPSKAAAEASGEPPIPELVIREGQIYGRIMMGDRAVLQVEAGIDPGDCEQMNVSLDPIEGREDLRAFQLFCENGEDYFSRDIDTFLISLATFEVYWQGGGTYRNEMGVCQAIDVPWFEVLSGGQVVVYQETGVFHDPEPGIEVECSPENKSRSDLDTLMIPMPE